jgi:hypothetical protein
MSRRRRQNDDLVMSETEHHAVDKLKELEHTAEVGESANTPWIVLGNVWVVSAAVVVVVLLLAMIAVWLSS